MRQTSLVLLVERLFITPQLIGSSITTNPSSCLVPSSLVDLNLTARYGINISYRNPQTTVNTLALCICCRCTLQVSLPSHINITRAQIRHAANTEDNDTRHQQSVKLSSCTLLNQISIFENNTPHILKKLSCAQSLCLFRVVCWCAQNPTTNFSFVLISSSHWPQ